MERSLSVLLPVRDAQSTLTASVFEMLEVLPELTDSFELVVIDDGSTDATNEVATELAAMYPQVSVVSHSRSLGRTAAIHSGLEHSSGEFIFLRDKDCCLPIDEIHKLWEATTDHELVLGKPEASKWKWFRHDEQAGFQIIRRRAVRQLGNSMASQESLKAELSRQDCRWHEIEVHQRSRGHHRRLGAAKPQHRSMASPGRSARKSRDDVSSSRSGKPKKPNYLSKLKDLTFGE